MPRSGLRRLRVRRQRRGRRRDGGVADVVVTDGFTGNVALKLMEAVSQTMLGAIRDAAMSSTRAQARRRCCCARRCGRSRERDRPGGQRRRLPARPAPPRRGPARALHARAASPRRSCAPSGARARTSSGRPTRALEAGGRARGAPPVSAPAASLLEQAMTPASEVFDADPRAPRRRARRRARRDRRAARASRRTWRPTRSTSTRSCRSSRTPTA